MLRTAYTARLTSKRTGLPPSMEDEDVSDNSDSEEEDEADEDSNGLCRDLDCDPVLTFVHQYPQLKSTTRTTIPTRKTPIVMTVVCSISIEYQLI